MVEDLGLVQEQARGKNRVLKSSSRAGHMLMYFVYVLRSCRTGRFYTGSTADPNRRLSEHNSGVSFSTRRGRPWELVHFEKFQTRAQAARRERHFKSGKGREELQSMLAERCP